MKQNRDSGIELLRIIAMLMVIGVHIFLYGGYFERACEYGGIIELSARFLKLFFRPAVNIFVIITGYFMARSAFNLKKSYKRLLSLYGTVYFYSIMMGMIFFTGKPYFETSHSDLFVLLRMFFPITSQEWYFLTDYFLLCLFSPFVNIVLQKLNKKEYIILIVISSFLMTVWQFIINLAPFLMQDCNYGYEGLIDGKNVFSFLYIYMLGGYIGMYAKERKRPNFIYLVIVILCAVINCVIWVWCGEVLDYSSVAISYANPFVVLAAVCFLMFFKDIHFHNRVVNTLGSTTIGIYAFHEMEYMRNFIWDKFDFEKFDCSNLGVDLISIFAVMLFVFLMGTMIELIRQQLFGVVGKLFQIGKKE